VVERATGKALPPISVRNAAGKLLGLADLDWEPGPGAGHPLMAPLVAAYEAQRRTGPRPVPQAGVEKTPSPLRRKKLVTP
jgi:hypothetical protein